MSQKEMKMNGEYSIDLKGCLSFGLLSEKKIIELLKNDARFIGNMMDSILCSEFSNVSIKFDEVSEKDMLCFASLGDNFMESRVIGKQGANIAPSKMIGISRHISNKKRKEWVDTLHGFIISDISGFPVIKIKVIPSDIGYTTEKITHKMFNEL